MLRWRLISAAVIIVGLLGLLHLDYHYPLGGVPGLWLLPLALVVSVLLVSELRSFWADRAAAPVAWPILVGAPLIVLSAAGPLVWPLTGNDYPAHCVFGHLGWPWSAAAVALILVFVGQMRRYHPETDNTQAVALSVLALAYAGLLLAFLVSLRIYGGNHWGMAALLSLIIVTKAADTGAYFVGRRLGRHKLAPRLSPGKTWEGLVGGAVTAMIAALLCGYLLVPYLVPDAKVAWGWLIWPVYGGTLTLAGVMGDLAESMLKRDAGRKDSSRWLPGLGGVMDILDSLLFAAFPAYLFWAGGLLGPG